MIDNNKIEQAILYLNTYGFRSSNLIVHALLSYQAGEDSLSGVPVSEESVRLLLRMVDADAWSHNAAGWQFICSLDSADDFA